MQRRGAGGSGAYEHLPATDKQEHSGSQQHAAQSRQGKASKSEYQLDGESYDSLTSAGVPVASVALAIVLMVLGMASFVLAWMHFTQEILGKEQAEIGFTVLGLLTFIPGYYHTRIAYYAWKGVPGYSWDDIPSF